MILAEAAIAPSLVWVWPFATILLCIAVLPLIKRTEHWWHSNGNKLLVAATLALATLAYYFLRGTGIGAHDYVTAPGTETVIAVLKHAVLDEYIPFMSLLFALYVIAGGIFVRGDIRATPSANTAILGIGALLASFIGTTGASMVLIRLLLRTNSERHRVAHTVVFFIFIVSNCGGLLLPTGDPPLFLGSLRGVPFFWTLKLWPEWLMMNAALLAIYYIWDCVEYRRETKSDLIHDRLEIQPIHISGTLNLLWMALVVGAAATLDPNKAFPGTSWHAPTFLREGVYLVLVGLSLACTSKMLRTANGFNYGAILEVACLFIGIFITMQIPLEILHARGHELGVTQPWQYFWATGMLSSFLDNAPTYVVFFELANTQSPNPGVGILNLVGGGHIREDLLIAVSLGAVFMGANTYIGNGPNFMVKTIAEQSGVKMPSFFGYMIFSGLVLIPLFIILTFSFLRPAWETVRP
ncbi:MAG: sodium:proton antiporter [Phycisphaerae bacterium]